MATKKAATTTKKAEAKTGKAAKPAANKRYTPPKEPKQITGASEWKKRSGHEVEVPSGNVCLAKRPGMSFFVEMDTIPNALMPIVQSAIDEGKAPSQRVLKDVQVTPELLKEMNDMYNDVVVQIMIQPKVFPIPEEEDERSDELLYVDEVDFEDKQFLFTWAVGGTANVEQFRKEQRKGMAAFQPS